MQMFSIWTSQILCQFGKEFMFFSLNVKCILLTLYPFPTQAFFFTNVQNRSFEKHCGKGKKCLLRAIYPFPTVFSTLLDNFSPFLSNLKLWLAKSLSLEQSMGKGNQTEKLRLVHNQTNCIYGNI